MNNVSDKVKQLEKEYALFRNAAIVLEREKDDLEKENRKLKQQTKKMSGLAQLMKETILAKCVDENVKQELLSIIETCEAWNDIEHSEGQGYY